MRFVSTLIHQIKNLFKLNQVNMINDQPLVVILGTTGVGKSKLSLEIGEKFNGEIISADSMQVYKGLDIVTNKVSSTDREKIPHHMIDFLDPLNQYTVVDYRNQTLPIIYSLLDNGKLPIIVGGTNYYIESLLFNILIKKPEKNVNNDLVKSNDKQFIDSVMVKDSLPTKETLNSFLMTEEATKHIPNEYLYNLLTEIDPQSGLEVHHNCRRRILRRLQIYQQHNKTYTELVREQKSADGSSNLGGPLRFNNCIILWLQCEGQVLNERLDNRVDEMLEHGLLQELSEFHRLYNQQRLLNSQEPDYTEGIFQSIGFKEFHPYLILSEEERRSKSSQKLLKNCIQRMKLVTRRYARNQIKWIKYRFLLADRIVPEIYPLDTTDLDEWESNVLEPALEIIRCRLGGKQLETSSSSSSVLLSHAVKPMERTVKPSKDDATRYFCTVCDRAIFGSRTWDTHMRSKVHSRMVKKQKQKQQMQQKTLQVQEEKEGSKTKIEAVH